MQISMRLALTKVRLMIKSSQAKSLTQNCLEIMTSEQFIAIWWADKIGPVLGQLSM